MSAVELKSKILNRLETANDGVLQDVLDLLEFESNSGEYKLTGPERKSIEIGLKQIENGQTVSHENVVKELKEWLKK